MATLKHFYHDLDDKHSAYSSPGAALPLPILLSDVPPATFSKLALAAAVANGDDSWSPDKTDVLYKIKKWGAPYFSYNDAGNITVKPFGDETQATQLIDLLKVVNKVTEQTSSGGLGLKIPLLLRFTDALKHRLEALNSAFELAVKTQSYGSHYQGVFPVKCNQDGYIVDDIVKIGSAFRFGLEAGSKAELLLAMGHLTESGSPDAFLVCNGFKDSEYICLALVGRKIGLNTVIVLEEESELDIVFDISKRLNVRPVIGMRAKLRTTHPGHFGETSGEKAKFGLTTTGVLRVVKMLEKEGMLDCLNLLHFHMGSMIPTTELLADAVGEATHIYCELVRLGASMKVLNIGGGLGLDYDGTRDPDKFENSVSYDLNEFALAVVKAVQGVCDSKSVQHPILCSESGRAIVSHHSVLIFEAFTATTYEAPPATLPLLEFLLESATAEEYEYFKKLAAAAYAGDKETCLEIAETLKKLFIEDFKEGTKTLEQLAAIDGLFQLVDKFAEPSDIVYNYQINLSIFTSIPDFWGIGQLFPIVPIHHLAEKPTLPGNLADLTCDSDGKIDQFIGKKASWPLHEIPDGRGGYYLGMFLAGAYEEAIGGFHNLFGDLMAVRVAQSDDVADGFTVTKVIPGLSSGDIIRAMRHDPDALLAALKQRVEEKVTEKDVVTVLEAILTRGFENMPYLLSPSSSSYLKSLSL